VEWRHWDVLDLFKDPENLPMLWGMSLAYASIEDRLRLFELLHPIHRLMDFWCTHADLESGTSVDDWDDSDWQNATVHLHPHLQYEDIQAEAVACIEAGRSFEISQRIKKPSLTSVMVESTAIACLLPLWQKPQSVKALAERYRQLKPVHAITLESLTEADALQEVKRILNRLDAFLYVLVEK
jgi:hypothetical protein